MFAKDLTGCFSHFCVEGGDHWIYVCIIVAHDDESCKPAYHGLEAFQHIGIFQLFEVKLESCVFWLADFFSGKGGRSSSASRDHFQCLLLESFVFWQCSLLIGSASPLECNQSSCGVWLWCCPFGLCNVHLLDALWWPNVFANTRSLKVANSRSLSPLSFVSLLQKGPQILRQFPQASLSTSTFQSPCNVFSTAVTLQRAVFVFPSLLWYWR